MEFISLPEVLKEMNTGNPFSISFVTADRKRQSGGKYISIPAAIISRPDPGADGSPRSVSPQTGTNPPLGVRGPDHYSNSTRNIRILTSNQVRKLHIRLITRFNNQKVRW